VQCAQIETPIEAVAERRKIASGVLLKVEGMVATRQAGFEIAQNGVDPLELGHLLGLAPGHDGGLVTAASLRIPFNIFV